MKLSDVGLYCGDLSEWGGGRDLLRTFAMGISAAGYGLTLIVPRLTLKQRATLVKPASLRILRSIMDADKIGTPRKSESGNHSITQYLQESGCKFRVVRTGRSARRLARVIRKQCIDVILPCTQLGQDFPAVWLGYIPDLQHKHLPQFFSQQEIRQRDDAFQTLINNARLIVVNSRHAKADLETFYPSETCKVFALPFSPMLEAGWLDTDPENIKRKHNLSADYFLISNQFWMHKDHATAFRALAMLTDKNIQLVCTGNMSDYRAPEYFATLMELTRELGIADRVRFLGLIPKTEQIAIMRGAIAVVQPSLFEGGPGGGAVYNAVAVGTYAIVSDIPVNREIEEEIVTFFQTGSSEDLAVKMMEALQKRKKTIRESDLLASSLARQRRLGEAFREIIEAALSSRNAVSEGC